MSNTEFDEFVKRQKRQAADRQAVDWDARRSEWLKNMDGLYEHVTKLLNKYVSAGDIKLSREPLSMHEERLGSYDAHRLVLRIGLQEVVLNPVGAIVIGANGRVDLIGSRGSVKIVLVPQQSSNMRAKVTILNDGHREAEPSAQQPTEWRWKISTPPPSLSLIDLTEESLMEAILEVADA